MHILILDIFASAENSFISVWSIFPAQDVTQFAILLNSSMPPVFDWVGYYAGSWGWARVK